MSNYERKSSAKSNKELDEVEELLRATEDEMVLKLTVNSHTSRGSSSSSPLDQDLIRRFESLKAPKKKITSVPPGSGKVGGDDVFARFSALKNGGKSSSCSSAGMESVFAVRSNGGDESENEEDEVAKLMQWAMDAARLDPSVSSSDDDVDEDTDDEDDAERKKKKNKKKPST